MKNLFNLFVIFFALMQVAFAQPKPQDTNLVWIDKYQISLANINNIQIAPDGKRIFVSSNDQTPNIRIIDFETGAFLDSIMAKGLLAGFSKDGKYFYTYTEKDIIKFDADKYKELAHLDSSHDGKGQFDHVKIMPDGRLAASIRYDGTFLFYIIDGESLIIQKRIPQYTDSTNGAPSSGMYNFCITPDGNYMAASQGFHVSYPPNTLAEMNIWDLNSFKIISQNPILSGYTYYMDFQFLPNSNILIISSANRLLFYDYSVKQIIQTLRPISENFILSNDNKRIYFGSTGGVRIVNSDNYKDICISVTPTDFPGGYLTLSNDEKSIINALPWTLMNLNNCLNDVGIKEQSITSDTLILPNPVKNIINIKLNNNINGNFIYSIVSIEGLTLKTDNVQILNGICLINVPDLINGTYLLNLNNDKYNFVLKFMVAR